MHANTCRFSIGASKWQVQFMQKQDNEARDTYIIIDCSSSTCNIVHVRICTAMVQVKVLIQRAKAWRNKQWPNVYPCRTEEAKVLLSFFARFESLSACKEEIWKLNLSLNEWLKSTYTHAVITSQYIPLHRSIHA